MECYLDCQICNERFNSINCIPKLLQCGHTVCLSCLNNMLIETGCIICPFDRLRLRDIKNINELKTNFTVLQICQIKPSIKPVNLMCLTHDMQIALICKTCDELVCPKCIRQHKFHDLYDLDHPDVIESLRSDLKDIETNFTEFTSMTSLYKLRLEKEISELNLNKFQQIKRIESYFHDIHYILEKRKKECISIFENKATELQKLLAGKKSGLTESERYCDKYLIDIHDTQSLIQQSNNQDKVVANIKRLKEFKFTKNQTFSDINSLPLRFYIELPPIPSSIFTDSIHILEKTPITRLIEIYYKEKAELMMKLEMRISNVPEHLLALNIHSTTAFLFFNAQNTNIAFSHLLERCTLENFGVGMKTLPDNTQAELLSELDLPPYDEKYVKSMLPRLKSKIRSFEFVKFAVEKLCELEFETALKVLYYAIRKEVDPQFCLNILKVALIALCAKAYKLASEQKIMETLPYLEFATNYLKAVFVSSELIYSQVESYIRTIYTNIETNSPEVFYPFFQRKCCTFMKDIEQESEPELSLEIPDSLQETLTSIDKYELLFWRGDKQVNNFFDDVKKVREKFKHVFKGISILYNRRTLLNKVELSKINKNI